MIRYIIRRLLWAVVLFISVTLATYLIFYIIPVDPARLAAGKAASPHDVQVVAHRLYLDKPIWQQYLHFLDQLVLHLNLGYSYANRQDVGDDRHERGPDHGLARPGRRGHLDGDRGPGRRLLGAPAALGGRPRRDDGRPDGHLGAPGVARAHRLVHPRLQARPLPDPGLLRVHGRRAR